MMATLKVTLRSYVDVLRWEDNLWGHEIYVAAAEGIIRNYLYLHDHPDEKETEVEPDFSSMTAMERKKAKAALRKQKIDSKKEEKQPNKNDGNPNKTPSDKKVDADPNGLELMNKVALEELKRYSSTLVKNAPHRLSTWLYQYDVAIRRGKATMALQALFKAKAVLRTSMDLKKETEDVRSRISHFASSSVTPDNDIAKTVYEMAKYELLNSL